MNEPLASTRHTIILCSVLVAVALAGVLELHSIKPGHASAGAGPQLYVALACAELGLLLLVRRGLQARGTPLATLVTSRATTSRSLLSDILWGLGLLLILFLAGRLLTHWFGSGDPRLATAIASGAAATPALWIGLSVIAGICEELTFRGYLLQQFLALWRKPALALLGQAILFGISHGYQGAVSMAKITVLGLIFGVAAYFRQSTVPGMFAHAGLDIIAGLG
jgi:uncharacterized protein